MKIKHFSGYGCVNARKIAKDTVNGRTTLVVEVVGDHERGIVRRDDCSLVKKWLVERFDKDFAEQPWWSIIDYSVVYDYGLDGREDRAIYTFTYPSKEMA